VKQAKLRPGELRRVLVPVIVPVALAMDVVVVACQVNTVELAIQALA
jgi:hypothetical protein